MAQTKEEKAQDESREELGVAKAADNAKLEHSDESGGATTRDDLLDAGVPMLQGDPSEPQGPEDAFGRGPKRGDYTDRTGGVNSAQSVPLEDGGEVVRGKDGEMLDLKPVSRLDAQVPRTEDIGEEKGKKGGVDTDPIASTP